MGGKAFCDFVYVVASALSYFDFSCFYVDFFKCQTSGIGEISVALIARGDIYESKYHDLFFIEDAIGTNRSFSNDHLSWSIILFLFSFVFLVMKSSIHYEV